MKANTESPPTDWGAVENAVETDELTKAFGDRIVVDKLSVRVPRAMVSAFVGPNGAGKSTTLRMLLGLIRTTSGSATILGGSIERPRTYLSRVGSLIEGPAFYPGLSGWANLEVLAALGRLDRTRIPKVLELVGLEKRSKDRVARYSLGMKQRLGVAAALLPEPDLLVLDEPANGLDPTGIAAMRVLLRRVANDGTTVLVSSHQLIELQQVADWVIIINLGKLKYQGDLAALLAETGTTLVGVDDLADVATLEAVLRKAGYEPVNAGPGRLRFRVTHGTPATINRLASDAGLTLTELHSGSASLEDIYFELTDGGSIA
ncbi:MAG: ATP-binding cassette domain-containing protein [Actinomycetota bacterium]